MPLDSGDADTHCGDVARAGYAKVLEGASEAFLGEHVEYPEGMEPRVKSRFEMLIAPKEHEMHHCGQLMVVERMLGITPHLSRRMEEQTSHTTFWW